MAKRLALSATVVGMLALVVSMVVPAVANNGNEEHVTLRLAEKASDDAQFDTDIDVGEKGFSVGDYTVIGDEPVYNRALTKQVGTASGDVLIVSIKGQSARAELDVTFDLKGGLITAEGPLTFSEQASDVQEVAVTGGTDAYKTAHGELELDTSNEQGLRFTFKLTL